MDVGGDPFQPVWVDSLKVNAEGTEGRTAYKEYPISAGPDRVFEPESIKFIENSRSGGGAIWHAFLEDKFERVDVAVKVGSGEYVVSMPTTIVIALHAETGSGPGNYNRGAWLNGYVHARTLRYK